MSEEYQTITLTKFQDMIRNKEFTHSKIITNEIKKKGERGLVVSTSTKYQRSIIDVFTEMPTQKILQNTTYNFKLTQERGNYKWCPAINMSFQNKDANGTFNELINMVILNNFTIEIYIKLKSGRNVYFKL
jgi:hypothetical protein